MTTTARSPISATKRLSTSSNVKGRISLTKNERPTAAVLHKTKSGPLCYLLTVSCLLFPRLSQAGLLPILKDGEFKRISFVGRCEQNQWSSNKDESIELMLSAEPGESCEARL